MREKDVAELWEETLQRMRACFDFTGDAQNENSAAADRAAARDGADPTPTSVGETLASGSPAA